MKIKLNWKQAMQLEATADGNTLGMDAKSPIGQGTMMTPKELVAAGIGGCTAMDVLALLKKHKQNFSSLAVEVDIETTKTTPSVFSHALIRFEVLGGADPKILLESVMLSQTKYCGVSAMLSKVFPIEYKVFLNNEEIGSGQAKFE